LNKAQRKQASNEAQKTPDASSIGEIRNPDHVSLLEIKQKLSFDLVDGFHSGSVS
jgi:hypothetical protein